MRKLVAACVLAGLVVTPAQAQDAQPRAFNQDGAWALDYGDDYCRLAGNFTNGGDRIALAIERIAPGEEMRVAVVSNAVKPFRGAAEIGLSFLPAGTEQKLPYLISQVEGGEQYLLFAFVHLVPPPRPAPPTNARPGPLPAPALYNRTAEQAAAQAITGISLGAGMTSPATIQTGALNAPVKALQACTDDLLKSWGLDVDQHRSMSRPAAPLTPLLDWLPANLVKPQDAPRLMGGSNSIRLMIDAVGTPSNCHIVFPTLEADRNQSLCAAILKSRFSPALDKDGKPMASFWSGGTPYRLMRRGR